MSNAISGAITVGSTLAQVLDANANRLNSSSVSAAFSVKQAFAPGTAANQANKIFVQTGTAAASPLSLDLTTVICADGSTGFAHVRGIMFFNTDTTDGQIFTFTEATNFFAPWLLGTTPSETIEAGGVFTKIKPYGTNGWVVDSTHKILTFDPGSNTVPYTIIVFGD